MSPLSWRTAALRGTRKSAPADILCLRKRPHLISPRLAEEPQGIWAIRMRVRFTAKQTIICAPDVALIVLVCALAACWHTFADAARTAFERSRSVATMLQRSLKVEPVRWARHNCDGDEEIRILESGMNIN